MCSLFHFIDPYEILHAGPLKTSIVFYVYLITVKSIKTPAEIRKTNVQTDQQTSDRSCLHAVCLFWGEWCNAGTAEAGGLAVYFDCEQVVDVTASQTLVTQLLTLLSFDPHGVWRFHIMWF